MAQKQTLGELIAKLSELDPEDTLYASRPWTAESAAVAVGEETPGATEALANGLEYLLEVDLAIEVVQVWSKWREGATPSIQEMTAAVIHYAQYDAYLAP